MRFDSLGWLGETRTKWKKFAKSNILPAELKALHLQIMLFAFSHGFCLTSKFTYCSLKNFL